MYSLRPSRVRQSSLPSLPNYLVQRGHFVQLGQVPLCTASPAPSGPCLLHVKQGGSIRQRCTRHASLHPPLPLGPKHREPTSKEF